MSLSTPTKPDERAVLFAVAELLVFFLTRRISEHVSCRDKLLVHAVKRQRVEQVVEPVVIRVDDVRVLTQVLTQCERLLVFVGQQISQTVQRHQND